MWNGKSGCEIGNQDAKVENRDLGSEIGILGWKIRIWDGKSGFQDGNSGSGIANRDLDLEIGFWNCESGSEDGKPGSILGLEFEGTGPGTRIWYRESGFELRIPG